MYKVWRIAWTEYLNAVRTKAFVLGLVMLPVLMLGGIVVQHLARNKVDIKTRRFAVVDGTGELLEVVKSAAADRNSRDVFEWVKGAKGAQVRPVFEPEEFASGPLEREQIGLRLSERVRKKELAAFLIIGKDVIEPERGPDRQIEYYTDTPTFAELPGWVESVLADQVRRIRWKRAGLESEALAKLDRRAVFRRLGLVEVTETGSIKKAREDNRLATFAVPFASMILIFMLVMSSAPVLMNTVLEEKLQKIAELLLSAVSPFQLLLGKLLGGVMVSITLSLLYLAGIAGLLAHYGYSDLVHPTHYLWFMLFQTLAILIYGSMFSAVGAACSEIKDAQNMMFPAMMMCMVPMFVWMPVMQSPTSAFARLISLFPPATPMLMMLRISIPPGPPWWEVALGVVLTTCFMLGCVWAAGKIFRIGMLSHGQTPSFRRLVVWIFSR